MISKAIRWFEVPTDAPAGFHTTSTPIVCLNYKDYDNRNAGVEAWFLTHDIAIVTLISEWADPLFEQLTRGAQDMVDYAASDNEYGFRDGNFYGAYWIHREDRGYAVVYLGLAYASLTNELTPIQGMKELPASLASHLWLTPQFAVPLQVEVRLPDEPQVRRVSRYNRAWVI
jgi:hypothetical protein